MRAITSLLIPTALLCSCSSFTPKACQNLSTQTGYQDSLSGYAAERVDWLVEHCPSVVIAQKEPFRQAYLQHYQRGLAVYCTPENALNLGLAGEKYRGICPIELETEFLTSYLKGLMSHPSAPIQPSHNASTENLARP